MRWGGLRRSQNVEDRRHLGGRRVAIGGGLGGIVFLIFYLILGGDPQALLDDRGGGAGYAPSNRAAAPADDEQTEFVRAILGATEDVWRQQFASMELAYREPTLVLFAGATESSCGMGSAAMGPFYCPADQQVYIDLSFFDELDRRFGAPGDFAQAYVIAHEVGHHVQHLLGTSRRVQAQRGRLSEREYNDLSVRLELQADFYAGVWAHHTQRMRDVLERGDLEEALSAAAAIGDDRLQKQAQGYAVPDSFTHGTSAQRVKWFRRGFETGDLSQGDTFNISRP